MKEKQTNFEDYLERKFISVLQNLKDANLVYEDVIDWEKRHWKEFAGIGVGITIFNFLHPSPASLQGKDKCFISI
jgi:hypothetical protein